MFVSCENYENLEAVEMEYPGAAHIEEVEGGWMVFEAVTDYETWSGQA